MDLELKISYKLKPYNLKAKLEYQSEQIIRIRVWGIKGSILFETNNPLLKHTNSKKAIQWKIKEGSMDTSTPESSRLLLNILEQLEYHIKKEFPLL